VTEESILSVTARLLWNEQYCIIIESVLVEITFLIQISKSSVPSTEATTVYFAFTDGNTYCFFHPHFYGLNVSCALDVLLWQKKAMRVLAGATREATFPAVPCFDSVFAINL
jgi:hypothetical protein